MKSFLFETIAKTGDNIASVGNLTSFENTSSINDEGLVAFIGRFGTGEALLVGDDSNSIQD